MERGMEMQLFFSRGTRCQRKLVGITMLKNILSGYMDRKGLEVYGLMRVNSASSGRQLDWHGRVGSEPASVLLCLENQSFAVAFSSIVQQSFRPSPQNPTLLHYPSWTCSMYSLITSGPCFEPDAIDYSVPPWRLRSPKSALLQTPLSILGLLP